MSLNILRRRQQLLGVNLLPNYVILGLLLLLAIAPLSIVVFNAFKTTTEIGRNPRAREGGRSVRR